MVGSVTPPRHWRMKAMAAKETGRRVRRRRILDMKEWEEEEEEDEVDERREA